MVCTVRSLGISGINGYEVSVECSLSGGLPAFDLVGLPDAAVKEARERVRAACKNNGQKFPVSRVTVNLAPADTKKAGTLYDLPILLSILAASGAVKNIPKDAAFIGELSLAGEVRNAPGMLSMALSAADCGINEIFVPADCALEASFADNVKIYPVSHINELLNHLSGEEKISAITPPEIKPAYVGISDFSEVKGQENAKRALEVAAAGGHNVLMIGPPGAGKSMLSKRLPSILPDMTQSEMLESTTVHSVCGLTSKTHPIVDSRPFRSPHHTVSATAMSGGGSNPKPGEISLAHNGVLFLDELPEFGSEVLETLRQPLEDGQVTISRVSGSASYPSRFMLVCAMNPCKCGWHGHPSGRCTCTPSAVQRYQSRVSGPLLDRIDIYIEVPALEFEELESRTPSESSAEIRERVNKAREIQQKRFSGTENSCNAYMGQKELHEHCALDESCSALMKSAFDRLGLTARSYDKILRVARTIADLDGSERIQPHHLAEAIQYRTYDLHLGADAK